MEQDTHLDCCFTRNNNWFRYRVETSDYYYSVGGGVHLGETAEDAVLREVYEETGVRYEIERLAFIHENFFTNGGMFEGLECHEISLYFLMKSRGTQELNSNSYCLEGKEFMNWIPISELKNLKAFPTFFVDKLTNMTNKIEHIVTKNK
ncbi:NUDIX domain-containing protein [Clostridium sp.]|uniref:NUDIX hydrolase n=1 Tax=Clostridium sp. TaxID=1506 RepID=UPI002584F115|nr:NUDIX domain-containing protein [Clostridium sp.]MDF2506072.1 hydrolase [Clostridium sp.]